MIEYELMPHQKEAVWKSTFTRDLYLAFEVGTGKTPACINILRQLYARHGSLQNTLILAPLIVLKNWKKEFGRFSKITPQAIEVLEGPVSRRIRRISELTGPRILITNYDVFQNRDFLGAILKWSPKVLVADEAHYLKNPQSKRARAVAQVADQCEHRYLLSGTPILNNALDLFMQYRILDKGETFGKNFFVFRHQYFEDENAAWSGKAGHFPKWMPRAATYRELSKKIEAKTLRVLKRDVLKDLPPLVEEDSLVEMGKDQEKAYLEMKRDFITFVQGKLKEGEPKAVVAKLAITKALRMLEIISGYAKTEDGLIVRFEDNPRIVRLEEHLSQLVGEHKIIVWSIFKENYRQIAEVCERLGVKYTEIHGDIPNKEKFKNVDYFNEDKECRILIGNPGAGGVGINLVPASYSIYYTRGFKLSDDLQSEARNYRKGSEVHAKITRVNIVCPGTIDELVASSILNKEAIGEAIVDRIKDI